MTVGIVISYTLYSLFIFYQQLHLKDFRGSSKVCLSVLTIFSFLAMIGGLIFLVVFGIRASWLSALALFCISLGIKFVWFPIEAALQLREAAWLISIAGFVAIPICAYFMWSTVL